MKPTCKLCKRQVPSPYGNGTWCYYLNLSPYGLICPYCALAIQGEFWNPRQWEKCLFGHDLPQSEIGQEYSTCPTCQAKTETAKANARRILEEHAKPPEMAPETAHQATPEPSKPKPKQGQQGAKKGEKGSPRAKPNPAQLSLF